MDGVDSCFFEGTCFGLYIDVAAKKAFKDVYISFGVLFCSSDKLELSLVCG